MGWQSCLLCDKDKKQRKKLTFNAIVVWADVEEGDALLINTREIAGSKPAIATSLAELSYVYRLSKLPKAESWISRSLPKPVRG
jgi:hypothetical protein